MQHILDYWYYFLPDSLLILVSVATLVRLLLCAVLGPPSAHPFYRLVSLVSQPAVATVNFITPRAVPLVGVFLLTLAWLYLLRFLLLLGLSLAGLLPLGI